MKLTLLESPILPLSFHTLHLSINHFLWQKKNFLDYPKQPIFSLVMKVLCSTFIVSTIKLNQMCKKRKAIPDVACASIVYLRTSRSTTCNKV